MDAPASFAPQQLQVINDAVAMAEELVSNYYKMSASQWLSRRYDVKTLAELQPHEIVQGPFAQIIRYRGRRRDQSLESSAYDFYKICLQDHTIFDALDKTPAMRLFPFILYIVTHELVHIVRFSKFLQNFDASSEERLLEEKRVHAITLAILRSVNVEGLQAVLAFYVNWHDPCEDLQIPPETSTHT